MTKRIKKVFSGCDQIIHLWANQSQSDARCSNVFFEGKSIYSYGSHYELGRMMEYNGVTVAVINDRGYSVTTAKHISKAWSAVSHMPRVKSSTFDIKEGLLTTQGRLIDSLFDQFSQTKFWNETFEESGYLIDKVKEFNKTCLTLKHKELTINIPQEFYDLVNEHIQSRIKRAKELQSPEVLAKKQAAQAKKFETEIVAWRQGGHLTANVRSLNPQVIRIVGNEVQTSRGATVPLSDAMRLLTLVEAGKAKEGDAIGGFTFNCIEGDIVKIGCHNVSLVEAKSVLSNRLRLVS